MSKRSRQRRQSRMSRFSCGLFGSSVSKESLQNQIDELTENLAIANKNIKGYETQIDDLQKDLDDAKTKIEKLTETNSVLEKKVQRQEEKFKTLATTEASLIQKVNDRDVDIATLTTNKSDLEKIANEKDEEIKTLKDRSQLEKQDMIAHYGSQIQSKVEEIQSLKNEFQREKQLIADYYSSQLQSKEKEIQIKAVEIQSSQENLQKFQKEIDAYARNKESEVQSLKSEILQKDNTIKQLIRQRDEERTAKEEERHQKDEALTRLSAVAGDRLRNNNPGITDLSDPNRPMKIAEKFTEMYDNDWTDAMEALEELKIEEDQCVEVLLHFLTDAYEECERIVLELDSHLVKAVTLTVFENGCKETEVSDQSKQSLPAELTKPIRDLRKTLTKNCVDELQKKIPHLLKEKRQLTDEHMKACKNFIADCITYAWMMQIQDPPVHIEWKFEKGSKIDTNILRSYTKAGDHVDFVVWPVLYLHKGGPVLNKGVVQPIQIKG